ncbi:MAG: hypothetical protein ACOWWR_10945 [Eubacteriales bacterium]
MRTRNIAIGLIVFFAFIGCASRQTDFTDRLVLINYYGYNEIRRTDSLLLDRTIISDTLRFTYRVKKDTLAYSFKKSVDNDSSIYLYGQNCPLIANKTFKINNQDFTIFKYYYDEENSSDEESSFFYHRAYGFLVGFNDGWLDLIFSMDYDDISKILIDSIISDRTGFYLKDIPPPPDSLLIEIEEYE